jgi:hypothetical protein
MQHPGYGLPRTPLLGTWVNRVKKKGRSPVEVGTPAKMHLGAMINQWAAALEAGASGASG